MGVSRLYCGLVDLYFPIVDYYVNFCKFQLFVSCISRLIKVISRLLWVDPATCFNRTRPLVIIRIDLLGRVIFGEIRHIKCLGHCHVTWKIDDIDVIENVFLYAILVDEIEGVY